MATAFKGSSFNYFGHRYRDIFARSRVELKLRETEGAVDNIVADTEIFALMALCACAKSDRCAGGRTRHRASNVPLSAGVLPNGSCVAA